VFTAAPQSWQDAGLSFTPMVYRKAAWNVCGKAIHRWNGIADITDSLALGWRPRVDIREGLRRTVEYFRQNVLPEIAKTALHG
jgi:nucleoside-diphosphate-sugar epimerase